MSQDLIKVFNYPGQSECPKGYPTTKGLLRKRTVHKHMFLVMRQSLGLFLGDYYVCVQCGMGLEMPGILNEGAGPLEDKPKYALKTLEEMGLEASFREDGTLFSIYHPKASKSAVVALSDDPLTEYSHVVLMPVEGRVPLLSMSGAWEKYGGKEERQFR